MGIATVCSSAFSYIENNEVNRAERNDLYFNDLIDFITAKS